MSPEIPPKPAFTPKADWQGQAAYIIGGGSSLAGFNFNVLAGRNVLGINDAFRLGPQICKICIFGDAGFFHKNVIELEKFKGEIISLSPNLLNLGIGWLNRMKREKVGLYSGDTVGWNHSTGAAAINFAISKGATKIYLLGYDLGRVNGTTHWHKYRNKHIPDDSYARFEKGFRTVHAGLTPNLGVEVFNVTDGSSKLPLFNRIDFAQFYNHLLNERH